MLPKAGPSEAPLEQLKQLASRIWDVRSSVLRRERAEWTDKGKAGLWVDAYINKRYATDILVHSPPFPWCRKNREFVLGCRK